MKRLVIFTAALLSSLFSACGFYPYGEDIRFYFLNPDNFSYQDYSSFYYSSLSFEQNSETLHSDQDNEKLWRKYCNNKILLSDISIVLKDFSFSDIQGNSNNPFLTYLYSQKDTEAIDYLKFAKNCEYFNTWQDDPWERNVNIAVGKRAALMKKAISLAEKSSKSQIKKRYAFLALRLAFYNRDMKSIQKVYSQYFSVDRLNDVIDVWALYFNAISEKNKALQNLYFAKVFAASPEKRFVSWQYFSSKVPIKDVLSFARDRKTKANVLLLYGINNPDKNLENIKDIYTENPKFDGLNFLLYRELAKLEDWIFTPYYSLFSSSIKDAEYWENDFEKENLLTILERTEIDRRYAGELLKFIDSVDFSKIENPHFWKYVKTELLFMTKKYSECIYQISELEKSLPVGDSMRNNIEIIKALALFANQSYGNAKIPEITKNIIIKNKNNKHFIFALGRELEYLGNSDDAALLYASLDATDIKNYDGYNFVYFKSLKNSNLTYYNYYYNYFDYLDAVYSPEQLQSFISKIENLKSSPDLFYKNFYQITQAEIDALYDLLGTKYIRKNNLKLASNTFNKLGEKYFDAQYSLWEREGKNSSAKIFAKNPFFYLKFTPDFIPEKEHFRVNKISITRKLIEYLAKADNPKEKNRDYYYFVVANCYYNMSQYGNAWMMRRYALSSADNFSIHDDNEEFNTASLAKFYYGKALENAKTIKFKALCLRMQGRCENYKNYFDLEKYSSSNSIYDNDSQFMINKYYQDLKNHYSDQYHDMMSGCDSFKNYFKARR